MGHHEFADSANNGPWGRALTEEFIPAFERRYVPQSRPEDRFLTGHSSGGWSSLWLQVAYPDFFNGTWSTAPDSVDFRDFTGIDVYEFENAYVDPGGEEIPLMRRNGEWAMSIRAFVERERERRPVGGQFYSFNAVFSPRGEDGTPMQLFDWETGAIDSKVAESWKKYDIVHVLDTNWTELAPRLRGKLHVYIGTLDTFRLEGACRLLDATLKRLGSDSEIILVEGRDHGSLFSPHKELWPRGMRERIHREMSNRFEGIREVDL
jgi:S-formylglutathione hydrolase FrmB